MKKNTIRRIAVAYVIQYHDPIELYPGDQVHLGEEEKEEKWKGWIWAETKNNKGWIPKQVVDISADKKMGIVNAYYTARELDVMEGDMVEIKQNLNGWTWARNLRTGHEGWIPDEVISAIE